MSIERLRLVKDEVDLGDARVQTILNSSLILNAEVTGTREGGIVDCWVPVDLIDREEVPVKKEWAESLAKEMREIAQEKGGTGQLSPVILGLIEGEDNLKIIDGFHRDAALKMNGEERVYSAVQLTDWDGLYDVRIFTAKDHAHVRFSRVVQWIREVWGHSGLSDKMTLEQAILLYRFDTPGSNLGLDGADVNTAKTWVARKEQQWDMAAMTIHAHLKVAETVDPKLVHSTREKKNGDILEAPTQAILKIFANLIPDNFELQNLVMDSAMANNLKGPQVKALCEIIKDQELNEASQELSVVDFDELQPSYGKTQQNLRRRAHDVRYKGKGVFARVDWEIQSTLRRAKQTVERKEDIEPGMVENVKEAIAHARALQAEIGKVALELGRLINKDHIPSPVPRPQPKTTQPKQKPEEPPVRLVEATEDGSRQDIISFLSGKSDIGSVRTFTARELSQCFCEMEKIKGKDKGWRERFAFVQQENLKGRLTG